MSNLIKALVIVVIWVVLDGIIVRLLVGFLRGMGKLVGLLGDNPVARLLLKLPDTAMPITSYIWSLIGPWVILALVIVAIIKIITWWASHPKEGERIGGAVKGAGRAAGDTLGSVRNRRSTAREWEDEWELYERPEARRRPRKKFKIRIRRK
ncbi:MAG: hypothetical protein FJ044_00890 [Candidatus Cloacimonetes bacterium]|nr:hypothetical protein [Candidatus Cloacimonadota bacterium]